MKRIALAFTACAALAACAQPEQDIMLGQAPALSAQTPTRSALAELPPPTRPVPVAVYRFDDQTGQHKPNSTYSDYSRAVTQGAAAILVEALLDTGDGAWFEVYERERLGNLLQERKIIDTTRQNFLGEDGQPLPPLAPMKYAGIILEGGIIGYDSDVITGGAGARYLGIGGSTEYRRDVITVSLRATSVKSGRVLESVSASKTVFSVSAQGGVFKFVSLDNLLEIETGFSINEPVLLATRQAVEKAVLALVAEGSTSGLWAFADDLGGTFLSDYADEKATVTGRVPATERTTSTRTTRRARPAGNGAPSTETRT